MTLSSRFTGAIATAVLIGGFAWATVAAAAEGQVDAQQSAAHFIYFDEPGALQKVGGSGGLQQDGQRLPRAKFDGSRADVVAWRAHLADVRHTRIAQLSQVLGRPLQVTYEYDIHFSGIAADNLTAADAALLAAQPGVRGVEPVRDYPLDTDRGPAFINADGLWDGSNAPGGVGFRGEDMVIGVLDSGINLGHPAFANDTDPSCGLSAQKPKLVARDCLGSSDCTGATPVDSNGHGSHTASTAAGNAHTATGGVLAGRPVSGVAPCAQLIAYKVCPTNSCNGAAIQAAIQTAILDQVDVINFSISGGTSPWVDTDRAFLDMVDAGIFVSASGGNTSAAIPNPVGQVAHRGPWVMTVAYSSHDRISSNPVSLAGGPQDLYGFKSSAAMPADVVAEMVDTEELGNLSGCPATGAFPAGSLSGQIALMERGGCDFSEKVVNAIGAGAVAAVIYNNLPGQPPFLMGNTAGQAIPSLMVSNADGLALRAHLDGNPTALATLEATVEVTLEPEAGDVLNTGSLRGPIAGGIEATKPDLTGPGTNIFAAYAGGANAYSFLSGSSMSSPHVAGSAALILGLQPDWTVPEVKSALMMTASKDGLKDFVNGIPSSGPWDVDDVGNGRVDLTGAARAGLVLHETTKNFLAAEGDADAQRALNLASVRNTSCTPSCTWTRTVRNTLDVPATWNTAGASDNPNLAVTVAPASFAFTGDTSQTQVLTITATPTGNQTAAVIFGEVLLTEAAQASPDLHFSVAIKGQGEGGDPAIELAPAALVADGNAGSATPVELSFEVVNSGSAPLLWTQADAGRGAGASVVWDQPETGTGGIVSDFFSLQDSGAYTANDFELAAETALTELVTPGFDNSGSLAAQTQISWAIYPDDDGEPAGNPETAPGAAVWSYTSAIGGPGLSIIDDTIRLDLVAAGETLDLAPGTWWLTVYPTYVDATATVPGTTPPQFIRWNWRQAEQVGVGSKLISPVLFGGIADWTLTGTGGLGTAIQDTAMTLSGIQGEVGCGAPWLSIDPDAGTVAVGAAQTVTVSLTAAALDAGTYTTNICIDSNDPVQPTALLPVTFTVAGPADCIFGSGFDDSDSACDAAAVGGR